MRRYPEPACVIEIERGPPLPGRPWVVCLVRGENHRIFRTLIGGNARLTMRRSQADRSVLFRARFVTMLVLGGAILPATAWAALPQVSNLRVQSTGMLTWDGLTGAAGDNLSKRTRHGPGT